MRFQNISIDDGLSLSSVYCINKDSKGFMWFGTEDGLNRFDGYQFKIYRSDVKDRNSICYKWIEHIEEDQMGNIWFGSRNGLSKYNPVNERFQNYKTDARQSIVNDTVTCLKSFQHMLCVGTKGGLSVFDLLSNTSEHYKQVGKVSDVEVYDDVLIVSGSNGLYKLGTNRLLEKLDHEPLVDIYVDGSTLFYSSQTTIKTLDLSTGKKQSLSISPRIKQIENVICDRLNRLWINTREGLWLHSLEKEWSKKVIDTYNETNSLATNTHKAIALGPEGLIWYATHGDGLFIINENVQVKKFIHNPTDKQSVSQNSFNCIYNDHESGNMWLGTYGAGINVYHPGANKFDLIKHNPLNNNSLPSNFIWSIHETTDSCLWIGTNDRGLCHYCPKQNLYTHFSNDPSSKKTLANNTVREVYEDSDGTIWVGTDGGGLNRFNPSDWSFTKYVNKPSDTTSISHNSVRVVFEDSQGNLWVGTRFGLNQFIKQSGTFKRYLFNPDKANSLSNNFVYASIIEDKDGMLWIGTYGGGLNKFNPKTEEFTHYTTNLKEGKSLSNDIVFAVYEDPNGLLWVGTNEGLNILDPKSGEVKILGMKDGLPNEVIYSIVPDNNGLLWLSTNHGISCLNSADLTCRNFDVSDGLQSNEFNGGAFHKGKSGRLYFGGVYGLNILNPNSIQENDFVNKPVITRFEVLGNELQTNFNLDAGPELAVVDSQYVLSSNISYTSHIVLDYSERFFAIEYSGLNYLFPTKTSYAFQLSPLDKKWTMAGNRNYVSFANIKPGDYQFRVISTNSDNKWGKEMASLGITIKPPFWLTNWFIALEVFVLLLMIGFIHRFLVKIKTNKALKNQNLQILEANMQLKESEDNLREMNVTKDKFFSIISHDLKNPFTSLMSISNMLDENYDETDDEDIRYGVSRINNSVKHIYLLLENLLTWSRSQRGKICFQNKDFDLSMLITENINLYKTAAEKKQLKIENRVEENVIANGDRNTIGTIIRNLSGNAIKFTPAGGKITYSVAPMEQYLKIIIKDSGVGISPEDQSHLFCIDKKLKTEGTEGEKGTGLGLIICKEFAEKNGGEIGVTSARGEGSEFWFTVKTKAANNN